MRALRAVAALALAFSALFVTPAHAFAPQTFQFTFFWTAKEFTFTDQAITVTVVNDITNKIGGNGEVIDTYRITLDGQVIEVTEKHQARDYNFTIVGTKTIRLEGIDRGFWGGNWGPIMTVAASQAIEPEPEPVTESPTVSEPIQVAPEPEPVTESPTVSEPVRPEPAPVAPPQPSASEVKEIAQDVLAEYEAMWAKHGISEADYSSAREVVIFNWAKSQYLQLIGDNKREKAAIAALSMRSQIGAIERAYLAGSLRANPVVEPAPKPTPPPEPVEPAPTASPEVEPTPAPTPEPPKNEESIIVPEQPEQEPIVEPKPEQPAVSPEEKPAPEPETGKMPTEKPRENEPSPLPRPEPSSSSEESTTGPVEETDNGIIVEVNTPEELAVLAEQDDPELPQELAAIPLIGDAAAVVLELFNDLGNVGADMTPEVREKSEEVVVAAVIVGQIATAAVASAASVASRKVR